VADAALLLAAIAGADPSDPLSQAARAGDAAPALRDDALAGVRLGLVEAHVPRAQMAADALTAWDRAVGTCARRARWWSRSRRRSRAPPCATPSPRPARARGDVAGDPNSPAPTANALLQYFAGAPRRRRRAGGGAARLRGLPRVLRRAPRDVRGVRAAARPPDGRRPGRAVVRALARRGVAALAASMRAAGVAAMVYPTMPFAAPRAEDRWPDVRTALGYGNWLGLPEVSVPAGSAPTGCRRSTSRWSGFRGRTPACWRWRTPTSAGRAASPRPPAPPEA
jgi:hypothetical protein